MRSRPSHRRDARWRGVLLAVLFGSLAIPASFAQPSWTAPVGLSQSMTVVATLAIDGTESSDAGDQLAAFVGGTVRGVASPQVIGGVAYYFLTVGAESNGETLTLRAYDASEDAVRLVCSRLNFEADATRGAFGDPLPLRAAAGEGLETCPQPWTVISGYTMESVVYAELTVSGTVSIEPADRVAALVGPEVRGVGVPFETGGRIVHRIEVGGDAIARPITFWVYDASSGTIYESDATTVFAAGGEVGTPSAPLAVATTTELPVELVAFEAVLNAGSVLLRWKTASETNNAGFDVEWRRAPGVEAAWQRVGHVVGAGTTSEAQRYTFQTEVLPAGRHAFRLRQLDYDGTVAYSPVVEVTFAPKHDLADLTVYPNPSGSATTIQFASATDQRVTVSLYDALGRRMTFSTEHRATRGEAISIPLDLRALPAGVYTVVARGERTSATHRLVLAR